MKTKTPTLFLLIPTILCTASFALGDSAPRYRSTLIEPLPGDESITLAGLNNLGHSVGASGQSTGFRAPVIYRDGRLERLADFRGSAFAINDSDQIVGYLEDEDNGAALLFDGDQILNLTAIAGEWVSPIGINNRGEIAGRYAQTDLDGNYRIFKYKDGGFRTVGAWPGAQPVSMNDLGQIVGFYNGPTPGSTLWHAVLFGEGTLLDLGGLPGAEMNIAYAINNRGYIVGHSFYSDQYDRRPFLYRNGKVRDLPLLGNNATFPLVITDQGDMVGVAGFDQNARGFLYHNNKIYDLNELVVDLNPRWKIFVGRAINDRGQIMAETVDSTNPDALNNRPVLLTPIDRK